MPVIQLSEPRVYNLPATLGYTAGYAYAFPLLNGIDVSAYGTGEVVLRLHSGNIGSSSLAGQVLLQLVETAPTDQDPPLTRFQGQAIASAGIIGGTGPQVATGFANLRSSHVNAVLWFLLPAGPPYTLAQIVVSADLVLRNGRDQWTPARLGSQLTLWTDQRDQTLVSGVLSNWGDESGNANNLTQGTQANRPTMTTLNGWSAPSFNGSSLFMGATTGGVLGLGGYHVFTVFSPSALAAPTGQVYNDTLLLGDTGTWYGLTVNTSGVTGWHYNSSWLNTPYIPVLAGYWYLVEWSYDGVNIRCRVSSGSPTSIASGGLGYNANPPYIGHGGGTGYLQGTIASIIGCNQYLASNDAQAVRAYLSSKYGVAA
jgi:hypothetical protein